MHKKEITIERINDSIQLVNSDVVINLPILLSDKIDDYWEKICNENPHLRRGKTFCVKNVALSNDSITINLCESDYAHYMYTLNKGLPAKYACRVCFGVVLVETSDNKYIVGEMNDMTATPNRLQLPGGGIEEKDIQNSIVDLKSNVIRELEEETGVTKNQLVSCTPYYLKQGGTQDFIAIIYKAYCKNSAKEVLSNFNKLCALMHGRGEIPELKNLYFIDKNKQSINAFVNKNTCPVVDYLQNTLLLDSMEQ